MRRPEALPCRRSRFRQRAPFKAKCTLSRYNNIKKLIIANNINKLAHTRSDRSFLPTHGSDDFSMCIFTWEETLVLNPFEGVDNMKSKAHVNTVMSAK